MVKRPKPPRWEADLDNPLPTVTRGDLIGVAWYDPGSFALWRKAGIEFAPGCPKWDDWFKRYQTTFLGARDQGFTPLKIVVKAQSLAGWLDDEGREDDFEARCAYVEWLMARMT